jgi:hypothetical protein
MTADKPENLNNSYHRDGAMRADGNHGSNLTNGSKLRAIIGGFHLLNASPTFAIRGVKIAKRPIFRGWRAKGRHYRFTLPQA